MPSSKYYITVTIEPKTLNVLRADPEEVLVLVRDMGLGSEIANGNIVLSTYESKELSPRQTFIWEESYSISETEQSFKVGVFILWLMHTIDN